MNICDECVICDVCVVMCDVFDCDEKNEKK